MIWKQFGLPWPVRNLTIYQYNLLMLHMQIDLEEAEEAVNGIKDPSKVMKKDPLFEKRLKEAQEKNLQREKATEAPINPDLQEAVRRKQQEITERLLKFKK